MEWIKAADSAGEFWEVDDVDIGRFLDPWCDREVLAINTEHIEPWDIQDSWKSVEEAKDDRSLRRWQWTAEEDAMLGQLGKRFNKDWSKLAEYFPSKSIGNIKKRFLNKHDPDQKKINWTAAEDDIIMLLFSKQGCSWTQIAEHLPGRSPDSIKNRFYGTLRKRLPHEDQVKLIRRPKAAKCLLAEEQGGGGKSVWTSCVLDEERVRQMTSDEKLRHIDELSMKVRSLEQNLSSAKQQIELIRATLVRV
jgi:hypothetical protein